MSDSVRTSEQEYGISAQPPPTCPMIDLAIKSVGEAQSELHRWERDRNNEDFEALGNRCDRAEYELSGIEDKLEDVRKNVEEIRAWGQEWKDLAKLYAPKEEIEPAAQPISKSTTPI